MLTLSGPRFFRYRKGAKFDLFQKFQKPKSSILDIPSEMNSNDPFYPILIPNTLYVKFSLFFSFLGQTGCLKSAVRGCKKNFEKKMS